MSNVLRVERIEEQVQNEALAEFEKADTKFLSSMQGVFDRH